MAAEAAAAPLRGVYLDPLQLDAVQEAANVGACNAARALSELTGRRVDVEPPALRVRPVGGLLASLAQPGSRAAVVVDTVLGDLAGQVVFVMPQARPGDGGGFTRVDDLEPGMFRHAADLVIGCYVDRIAGMLGLVLNLEPGAPGIHEGEDLAAALAAALDAGSRYAFCIDSRFSLAGGGAPLAGHFLFLPEMGSLPVIVGALFGGRKPDAAGKPGP